ncbi:alpha/beta-hydrolase [Bombardia bombarda]|uniref:Carboxylic ester hydrolase n=1 Tax=Bombardia bombarda TaxID=252184 RepID=A0AA40CGN4_9PEZI|nr:alpha/beta-hydrolase [Bombardia bombarda]
MRLACILSASAALLSTGGSVTRAAAIGSLESLPELTVRVSQGWVHGKIDNSTSSVRQFLGIPYGQPPIGALRFASPQPATNFGSREATELPPSCMQFLQMHPSTVYTQDVNQFNLQGLNVTGNTSEDCLTLSVWTPTHRNRTSLLPVVIFIYGGGFATGGQDVPYQNPAQWVQRAQDLVVVTFNYRLNIFGFPNAAGLPADERNPGLLDQRLAVEWVRDNIAAFGGDPQSITLWGHSAGGISVGYYQFAYPNNPIVSKVIMDSGSEMLAVPMLADPMHTNFTFVADNFGCGGLEPVKELACMRGPNVSAARIEQFIENNNDAFVKTWTGKYIVFRPAVDNVTVFADYTARAKAGEIAKIPSILGSNARDGVPFVWLHPNGVNETQAFAVTLVLFFCTTYKAATNRLAAGLLVYRYIYSGNISSISPNTYLGAYHSSELPMIFGTQGDYRESSLISDVKYQDDISIAMQDAWGAFASKGAAGMPGQDWPGYENLENGGDVRNFALESVVASTGNTRKMEALCPAYFQPANAPTTSSAS